MNDFRNKRIYVAGHRGLAGSAVLRALQKNDCNNLLVRSHDDLDLCDAVATKTFFEKARPEVVVLAAARVGGIQANLKYPTEFVRENLAIEANVIHEAWRSGVERMLFFGSSCIYPKFAPQPLQETALLSGPLEPTNRAYAVAKIAGAEMCWSYNRQYGTRFLVVMPTNLYGLGDNYDLETSHVVPALLRKFHEGKVSGASVVSVWGSGSPRRELLHADDMADACLHMLGLSDDEFCQLLGDNNEREKAFEPPLVNIGSGEDVTIRSLAELVSEIVGYSGAIVFDPSMPDGTPQKRLDVSKLARLGWKSKIGLRQGLELTYRDFLLKTSDVSGGKYYLSGDIARYPTVTKK